MTNLEAAAGAVEGTARYDEYVKGHGKVRQRRAVSKPGDYFYEPKLHEGPCVVVATRKLTDSAFYLKLEGTGIVLNWRVGEVRGPLQPLSVGGRARAFPYPIAMCEGLPPDIDGAMSAEEGPQGAPAPVAPAGANGASKPLDYDEACANALEGIGGYAVKPATLNRALERAAEKPTLLQGDCFKASLKDYARRDAAQTRAEYTAWASSAPGARGAANRPYPLGDLAFALFVTDPEVLAHCRKVSEAEQEDGTYDAAKLEACVRRAWLLGARAGCDSPREVAWRGTAFKRAGEMSAWLTHLSTKPL